MQEKIERLEKEIAIIKERNLRVETDKAWETSKTRIFFILAITYCVAVVVLYSIGAKNFFLNALVPAIGFFLSVQTLPIIKKYWVKKFFKKS